MQALLPLLRISLSDSLFPTTLFSMNELIRAAFNQFYTRFAWTYDAVAHVVSFGEWKAWGRAAVEFLPADGRTLEIAHGPGHLHATLRQRGMRVVGIDLSRQMGVMARRRVLAATGAAPGLARATALRLPFADAVFDAAVSTFPAEFVFQSDTLRAVARVLRPGGRFVIVPTAGFRGRGPLTRLIDAAYRVTGQRAALDEIEKRVALQLAAAGFAFESHRRATPRASVVVWIATARGLETFRV